MNKSKDLFGELVIARNLATRQQVEAALQIKARLEREGMPKHLGEIMILEGILTIEQVEAVLKEQDKRILECRICNTRYNVQNFDAGKRFKCRNCGNLLQIPLSRNSVEAQPEEIREPAGEDNFEQGKALLHIKGQNNHLVVAVEKNISVFIGSSPRADIQLRNEQNVAPLHCEIRNNGFDLLIFDCTNASATLVNDHPIKFFILQPGDRITLGSVSITVQSGTPPSSVPCATLTQNTVQRTPTVSRQSALLPIKDVDSMRFGAHLIKKGYLSAQIVSQYLDELEKLKQNGQQLHLGALLVQREVLSQEKLEEILHEIRTTKQFKCFKCQLSYNVSQRDVDREFKCRGCGEWLIVPSTLFEPLARAGQELRARPEAQDQHAARFGSLAVEHQFLTKQQLEELLKIQEEFKKAGKNIPLGDLCLKKRFLTPHQISYLLKLQGQGEEGITIEGYEIRKLLGKGANGVVFQAIQQKSGKVVALKVLTPELGENKEVAARFHREAGIAAFINHINLISGVEMGKSGDYDFFAMEYVSGETVRDILQRDRIIFYEEAINIAYQIAKALDYLHGKQIIHRDIKPANIMITRGGVAKLCDMGLARPVKCSSEITTAGVIMGTPYYLSPEQGQGLLDIDIRSDIYNLGATLYNMVTGQVPFKGQTPMETVLLHITQSPTPPDKINPEIPSRVSHCILKMMAKKPKIRYQTPQELIQALEELS